MAQRRSWALPDGYAAGALGVFVFGVGGIADSLWHTFFGVEVDLEALLSPAHLLLFAGATLILTTPVRADGVDRGTRRRCGRFRPRSPP